MFHIFYFKQDKNAQKKFLQCVIVVIMQKSVSEIHYKIIYNNLSIEFPAK